MTNDAIKAPTSAAMDEQAMKDDFNRLTDHCWMNLPRSEEILWEKAWKASRARVLMDHDATPAAGYEHYAAIREGHRNAAEDAWFSALPNIEPRRAFQAGFDAGYNTRDAAATTPHPSGINRLVRIGGLM